MAPLSNIFWVRSQSSTACACCSFIDSTWASASCACAVIIRESSLASGAPRLTTEPRSTYVASTLPTAPAATCACSAPIRLPDNVRTRGTFTSRTGASLTAMGGASAPPAALLVSATEREQAPTGTSSNAASGHCQRLPGRHRSPPVREAAGREDEGFVDGEAAFMKGPRVPGWRGPMYVPNG